MTDSPHTLTYSVTPDDLTAWVGTYFDNSPRLRRQAFQSVGIVLGIVLVVVLLIATWFGSALFVFAVVVGAVYCAFTFRREARKHVLREFDRSIRDSDSMALGEHTLHISADALKVHSGEISAVYPFTALRSIHTTSKHTFVFLDELTGFPIPRGGVLSGDYATFVDALHRRAENAAKTPQLHVRRD